MTERKLTEAEIMKALECCSKPVGENCNECPLKSLDCLNVNIEGLALDLINRKNAEIERLNFENLQMIASIKGLKETARAEAIKEVFSEIENRIGVGHDILDFWDVFDELKKEMGVEL